MADILSQDELDALLGQMQGGDDDEDDGELDPFDAVAEEALPADVPPSLADAVDALDEVAGDVDADLKVDDDDEIDWGDEHTADANVQMILNLPVRVSVELGRTRLSVADMLAFGQGAVIELDSLASDLLNLTVNKKVVAQGEAVVVNENFGFRVIEVDSVRERIRKL